MVARGARRSGQRVIAIGIKGQADPRMCEAADEFYWSSIVRVGQWIRILRRNGCSKAIFAGWIRKTDMYGHDGLTRIFRYLPDWTTFKIWFFKTPDKRNDSVLSTVANELAGNGIMLEECVKYTPDAMASEGTMTSRTLTPAQEKDIEFGWRIAKELGRLDIGQSIAVKEQEVIAVEAIEGTDRMLERAGQLCKSGGWSHIKVSKPDQDMRFDVPTIGPDTIENLHKNGAKVLCVEADKTCIVDRENVMALVEKYGMVLVARKDTDILNPAD